MYYEVFLDVLFVMNFLMDYFLLRLTCRLIHSSATLWRSLLGALIGAVGICLIALWPGSRILNTILVHVVINTLMVRFGCNLKTVREILKGVLILYICSFLLAGMMLFLQSRMEMREIKMVLLAGSISYLFLAAGIRVYTRKEKKENCTYQVCLYEGDKSREGKALLDTGNGLTDPVSGKPVNVIRREMLNGLLADTILDSLEHFSEKCPDEDFGNLSPHFVPFATLGCTGGLLVAITIDYLSLEIQGKNKIIFRPVVAFSDEGAVFPENYQMILHPNLIDS